MDSSARDNKHLSDDGTGGEISPVRHRLAHILEGRDFPALSQQIIETISALDDDASSLQRLTNIVLREYSLTLSVVRTANSVHYRRAGRQIQSATRAMLLLGARTVRQLASSLLLFDSYHRRSAGLKDLMVLSLLTANHAREVAHALGRNDAEEAHLCGMFRNLGEVLIACHFQYDYAQIQALMHDKRQSEASAAFAVLDFHYEDLGEELCRHWGMPDSVAAAMRARLTKNTSELSAITAFSHDLTHAIYRRDPLRGDPRRDLDEVIAKHATRVKLTREQVQRVVESALAETRELFVHARVQVDARRLRQLSEAACAALGTNEPDDDGWLKAANEAQILAELRVKLAQELESKIDPGSEHDLGQVVMLALEAALRGAPFDRVVWFVLSPDRSRLQARSGLGIGVDSLLSHFDFPMSRTGGPLPAALLQRKPLYVPSDRAMTIPELRFSSALGVGQFGIFPIIVAGTIVGGLYADRIAREPLPDLEGRTYVASLARLVMKAIEARRHSAVHFSRVETPSTAARALRMPTVDGSMMSVETKASLVVRLLQGEDITVVSRTSGVAIQHLEQWKTAFLDGAVSRLGAA